VKGDVLAHVGVVTATHDIVRYGGNAVVFWTGGYKLGQHRTGSVTVAANVVYFLRNQQVAESAVGISMGGGNRPQERDRQGGS